MSAFGVKRTHIDIAGFFEIQAGLPPHLLPPDAIATARAIADAARDGSIPPRQNA